MGEGANRVRPWGVWFMTVSAARTDRVARPGADLAADFVQVVHVHCRRKPAVVCPVVAPVQDVIDPGLGFHSQRSRHAGLSAGRPPVSTQTPRPDPLSFVETTLTFVSPTGLTVLA